MITWPSHDEIFVAKLQILIKYFSEEKLREIRNEVNVELEKLFVKTLLENIPEQLSRSPRRVATTMSHQSIADDEVKNQIVESCKNYNRSGGANSKWTPDMSIIEAYFEGLGKYGPKAVCRIMVQLYGGSHSGRGRGRHRGKY